jgi:hypothetical protein
MMFNDYPTKPIGGRNPYHCCAYCSVSQPAINGNLENHLEWCEYRRLKTLEQELELAKLEIECLKLDAQKPVYCVALGWSSEGEGQGEDLDSMKLFQDEEKALAYKAELEASSTFDEGWGHYVEIIQKFVNQK